MSCTMAINNDAVLQSVFCFYRTVHTNAKTCCKTRLVFEPKMLVWLGGVDVRAMDLILQSCGQQIVAISGATWATCSRHMYTQARASVSKKQASQ